MSRPCIPTSIERGETWQELPNPATQPLQGVALVDENTATAVGKEGTILRTIDGGLSWTQQPTGYRTTLWAVSFSGSTGYIVGERGVILRSEDAGAIWVEQPFAQIPLNGVQVIDRDSAVIVGDGEGVLRTDSGGR